MSLNPDSLATVARRIAAPPPAAQVLAGVVPSVSSVLSTTTV
jgi:hypothetical protein